MIYPVNSPLWKRYSGHTRQRSHEAAVTHEAAVHEAAARLYPEAHEAADTFHEAKTPDQTVFHSGQDMIDYLIRGMESQKSASLIADRIHGLSVVQRSKIAAAIQACALLAQIAPRATKNAVARWLKAKRVIMTYCYPSWSHAGPRPSLEEVGSAVRVFNSHQARYTVCSS